MTRSRKDFSPKLISSSAKATKASMRRLANNGCSRYWWYTSVPDIAVGLWALMLGIIMIVTATGTGVTTFGWVLMVVSLAVLFVVPRFLNNNFIIPSGLCLKAPEREPGSRGLCLLSVFAFVGVSLYSLIYAGNFFALMGALWASFPLLAYVYASRTRHYILALWCIGAFCFCQKAAVDLGLSAPVACGLIFVVAGVFLLATGVYTLLHLLMGLIEDDAVEVSFSLRAVKGWFTPEELGCALAAPDAETRYLAAAFLCEYIEPRVLVPLLNATHDINPAVATMARRALSSIWGPSPDDIMRWQMKHFIQGSKVPTAKSHKVTLEELRMFDHERHIIEKDAREHEREVEGVLANEVALNEHALSELIALATDAQEGASDVRLVATELLGATRTHRAYATLARLIEQGDRTIASAAAEGFRGAASSAVVHIEPLFGDSREWVRIAAVNAGIGLLDSLDEVDAKEANLAKQMLKESVFGLAHHPKPVTRAMSLELAAHYGEEATESLIEACGDSFALVRGEGVRALVLANPGQAKDYVLQALRDSRAYVRSTAINCVAYLKLAEACPMLDEMKNDSDKTVALLAERLLFIAQTW